MYVEIRIKKACLTMSAQRASRAKLFTIFSGDYWMENFSQLPSNRYTLFSNLKIHLHKSSVPFVVVAIWFVGYFCLPWLIEPHRNQIKSIFQTVPFEYIDSVDFVRKNLFTSIMTIVMPCRSSSSRQHFSAEKKKKESLSRCWHRLTLLFR